MREKLNMSFWQQQLREEISLAQVIPEWGLNRPPAHAPDPASKAESGHWAKACPNSRSPQKQPNLWPMGTLKDGLSPGTPWHAWGGPHLPDLESGMSTGTPWRLWGNPHFSPEPQPNPTRVVPMMGPGFQPPGPCPKHELGT